MLLFHKCYYWTHSRCLCRTIFICASLSSSAGEGNSSLHSVHKRKHKKHKKHKRKHHNFAEAPQPEPVVFPRPPPQLRLKIKLGGQTLGTKRWGGTLKLVSLSVNASGYCICLWFPLVSFSVPTFTVHPGVACPPSPLMIIDNDVDDDEDDEDDDEDDDEPSVPLEQYRAWLGKLQIEPVYGLSYC